MTDESKRVTFSAKTLKLQQKNQNWLSYLHFRCFRSPPPPFPLLETGSKPRTSAYLQSAQESEETRTDRKESSLFFFFTSWGTITKNFLILRNLLIFAVDHSITNLHGMGHHQRQKSKNFKQN